METNTDHYNEEKRSLIILDLKICGFYVSQKTHGNNFHSLNVHGGKVYSDRGALDGQKFDSLLMGCHSLASFFR